MDEMDREEYGKMLRDVYIGVLVGIVVAVSLVAGIFLSSKHTYEKEQARLAAIAAQKELDRNPRIDTWAWVNVSEWHEGSFLGEYREAAQLSAGKEYVVGVLREFDRDNADISRDSWVRYYPDDDPLYADPLLTLNYKYYLHVTTSLDGLGWFTMAPTEKQPKKLGGYKYIPVDSETLSGDQKADYKDGWGSGMVTVRLPVNGMGNLAVTPQTKEIPEELREYNYYTEERLGDILPDAPAELHERTRRVWVYHVFAEAYKNDPRDKKNSNTAVAKKITLRVRYYTDWDFTPAEYMTVMDKFISEDELALAPRTTIELVKEN